MSAAGLLPDGARGRMLALGLLGIVCALLWVGLAAPLISVYQARADQAAERRTALAHMEAVAVALPALRRAASLPQRGGPVASSLLHGDSDALAGASLQGLVQDMATAAGATLASTEVLPAEQAGGLRRVGLRVALGGEWPVLVAMLRNVEESTTWLLVDDLQMHASALIPAIGMTRAAPTIEAQFVVLGYRAGGPPSAGGRALTGMQAGVLPQIASGR